MNKVLGSGSLNKIPFELIFWVVAILMLALSNQESNHFALCPIANLGFTWCPGCGLGRSIGAILNGDLKQSLNYHYLGIPALSIIIFRIYTLNKNMFLKH